MMVGRVQNKVRKLRLENADGGQQEDVERRAARAEGLVQLGELSAGRQALEGEALAPGNEHTLRQLQRRTCGAQTPAAGESREFLAQVADLSWTRNSSARICDHSEEELLNVPPCSSRQVA